MKSETGLSEVELVLGIKLGDDVAFKQLHHRYERQVASLASRLAGNDEDAEEIVQDVFTMVFRKIDRFEGRCALSSWIYRITVNCALMKVRASKRRKVVDLVPLDGGVEREDRWSNIEAEVANRKVLASMRDIIETLPDKFRAVFLLRDVNDLSGRETAEFLGISESAVKSRLQRARELVHQRFEAQQVESRSGLESYIWEV